MLVKDYKYSMKWNNCNASNTIIIEKNSQNLYKFGKRSGIWIKVRNLVLREVIKTKSFLFNIKLSPICLWEASFLYSICGDNICVPFSYSICGIRVVCYLCSILIYYDYVRKVYIQIQVLHLLICLKIGCDNLFLILFHCTPTPTRHLPNLENPYDVVSYLV